MLYITFRTPLCTQTTFIYPTLVRERFIARNVTQVTPDLVPLPPPLLVTRKWAATMQKYVAPGKTLLLKGWLDPPPTPILPE